jgi:CheY-like chemotaxis protein
MLDAGQLLDSLLNLLLNARDACGAQGQIEVTARAMSHEWLEFFVDDTGSGFSEETLAHALDPFYTTKGGDGSGLGLPMVYDMVKLAGGDLRIANRPAATGASVCLRLPLRYAPENTGGLAMLVEDDEALRQNYRDMLMEQGYMVIEATSVDEALALLADLPDICLILSDLHLKGSLTGVDLARNTVQTTPTILMTSLPPSNKLHSDALGLAPVLSKPFDAARLNALLNPDAAQ